MLDWRERAHEFGLVPIDESDEPGTSVEQPPGRLLEEEEPEAFRRDPVGHEEYDEAAGDPEERSPDMSHEDLDLMRVYLRNVGRRRLLKASEEQAIGQRIEIARSELQSAFSEMPCALRTLLGLADRVKRGDAPAAELILLPDGGELNAENVTPVLDAFDHVARELQGVDRWRRKCEDPRATMASRAGHRKKIARAAEVIGTTLATLPIRPSLVDDIVTELRAVDKAVWRPRASARAAASAGASRPRAPYRPAPPPLPSGF